MGRRAVTLLVVFLAVLPGSTVAARCDIGPGNTVLNSQTDMQGVPCKAHPVSISANRQKTMLHGRRDYMRRRPPSLVCLFRNKEIDAFQDTFFLFPHSARQVACDIAKKLLSRAPPQAR